MGQQQRNTAENSREVQHQPDNGDEHSVEKEVGSFTIINDDCITAMQKMLPNSVDAIITDPPYNIKMADWDAFPSNWEFSEWVEQWGRECFRVVRPGGIICCFAAARTYHFTAIALERAGFQCRDMVEWCYWSGLPKGKNLKGCHEPIYLGWKPMKSLENFTFNIDACRIPVKEKQKKDGTTEVAINNLKFTVKNTEDFFS